MPLGGALRGTLPNPTLAAGSGGGALTPAGAFLLAAPATSVTFTGLDGDADGIYFLLFRVIKAVVAGISVTVRPNGITTNQRSVGTYYGAASGTTSHTDLRLVENGGPGTGDVSEGQLWFSPATGAIRTGRCNRVDTNGTNIYVHDIGEHWTDTATNVTSLDVVCDQANGMGAGSYFRLYKLA